MYDKRYGFCAENKKQNKNRQEKNMIVIAGLGNPGKEYEHTRHNAGYGVIDALARDLDIRVEKREHRALVGKGMLGSEKCMLVKPLTYMNLSGESIREILEYYNVPVENLLVISDDVALPVGTLRIRKKGSAGGHNGLKNIILQLATEDFARIRVGVGDKEQRDMISHVLGHFSSEDAKSMEEAFRRGAEAAKVWALEGADVAMNRFNTKPPKPEKPAKPEPPAQQPARPADAADRPAKPAEPAFPASQKEETT